MITFIAEISKKEFNRLQKEFPHIVQLSWCRKLTKDEIKTLLESGDGKIYPFNK